MSLISMQAILISMPRCKLLCYSEIANSSQPDGNDDGYGQELTIPYIECFIIAYDLVG